MDFEAIKAAAQGYQADMTRFLREMDSHPSESCEEKEVVHCIKAEMEKLGHDKVEIDGLATSLAGWATATRSSPSTPHRHRGTQHQQLGGRPLSGL